MLKSAPQLVDAHVSQLGSGGLPVLSQYMLAGLMHGYPARPQLAPLQTQSKKDV